MKARIALFLVLFAMAAMAPAAHAQFSESFDSGTGTPPGWTVDAPTGSPAVGWSADATPATADWGPFCGWCLCSALTSVPTFVSAPNSLNFNNGVDLDGGGLSSGSAMTPVITLSTLTGAVLRWNEMNECPSGYPVSGGIGEDELFVEVMDAAGTTVLLSTQMCIDYTGDDCAPSGLPPQLDTYCAEWFTWHTHNIDLSTLSATTFRIRFRFNDTSDALFGDADFSGWFVDDVQVVCPDAIAPSVPVLTSPADAACAVAPVTLDWADATDTSSCGPGPVTNYDYEVASDPAFVTIVASGTVTTSSAPFVGALGITYYWHVMSRDAVGNVSAFSPTFSFFLDAPLPPLAPDTLFVNVPAVGAQFGDPGFVDPVRDNRPVFSAIYRDSNCSTDTAVSARFQVSTDPTFVIVTFDSGLAPLSVPVLVDQRCPDLSLPLDLQKDTIYFWRILFADASGPGAWSANQSFRIGDDFDFGVREGSSHHGRRCWIATAASGSASAPQVVSLQDWRFGTLEQATSGQVASRSYHVLGAAVAGRIKSSPVAPLNAVLPTGFVLPGLAMAFGAAVAVLGLMRLRRS